MNKKKSLPYGYQDIENDDVEAVARALSSDFLTTGPLVESFENALTKLTKAKFAVSCSSGTSALHLACMALGIKKGDWVIVPSVTFLASANAVRYCNADVLFCDVDQETGIITPETLNKAINKAKNKGLKIKAVIVVHLTGRPVDLKEISKIVINNGLKLIADSCHAIGGTYSGLPIGSCKYEHLSTFSFHPVKTITTGEGGAVTTNSKKLASAMKLMRSHNMIRAKSDDKMWKYTMNDLGYNYRLSDIQCALGLNQLKKLPKFKKKRSQLVKLYNLKLQKFHPKIITPKIPRFSHPKNLSWHLYSVLVDFKKIKISKNTFMKKLREEKINTQVHYIPVHTQPYYKRLYGDSVLPGCKKYYERTISLPLFTKMNDDDIDYIVHKIGQLIK